MRGSSKCGEVHSNKRASRISSGALMDISLASKSRPTRAKQANSRSKQSSASINQAGALSSFGPATKPFTRSDCVFDQLDEYQKAAVEFALRAKTAGLFFEQGTGKTYITGGIVERLVNEYPDEFQALIVVPLTNIESTWTTFFRKNLPHVSVARSVEELAELPRPRVLLVHYEMMPKLVERYKKFMRAMMRWHLIVYDESQRLKSRQSITSRTAAKLHDAAAFKVILSGTPMDEEPADLWAQMRFLNSDVFGSRWKDFEDKFFEPIELPNLQGVRRGSWQWHKLMREIGMAKSRRKFNTAMLPEFVQLLKPYCLRVTKEDVLDLPPITYLHEYVSLRGEQRRLYDELRQTMVATGMDLTAPLKVTQLSKLQQITGGYVIDDNGETHCVGRAKMRRLRVILRRLGPDEKVVIFARYVAEVGAILRECLDMKRSVASIIGETDKASRTRIIDNFQKGGLQTIVSQIKTGGVGIDLFASCHLIVYSPTYSYIDFDQAKARVHRRGQTRRVFIHLMCAENTVDEYVYQSLVRKDKRTTVVLNQLKELTR